jgi:hypothetical protein
MVFMEGFDLADESLREPTDSVRPAPDQEREDASSKPHFRNGLP